MMLVEADKDNLAFISRDDPMLENVKEVLESMSNEEDIIGVYDGELENWKEINSAFVHGMKEGTKKGIEEGIEQGIEKEKLQIALSMMQKNLDISFISDVTGLNINRIQKMYENYNQNTMSV